MHLDQKMEFDKKIEISLSLPISLRMSLEANFQLKSLKLTNKKVMEISIWEQEQRKLDFNMGAPYCE